MQNGSEEMLIEIAIGFGIALSIFLITIGVNILPMIIIIGFAYMLYNVMDRNNLIKTPSKIIDNGQGITFDQIGGQDVAKNELLEALDFIKDYDSLKSMGIRPIRGILLTGVPGTGKTLMAKAAASYIDSVLISASGVNL